MAPRVVNGNSFSEDGWPIVDYAGCDLSKVPGTDVSVPIQIGIPNTILKAFAAALNEFIEPYNGKNDWGGWTESNSVLGHPGRNDGSNHLGGTAFDFNWDDHPMGNADAGWNGSTLIKGNQVPAVRELLDYCEGMVFWGNDWEGDGAQDSMHFQMGYNTYNNIDKCIDFIKRKIDPNTMKLLWTPSWLGGVPDTPVDVGFDRDAATQALYLAVEAFGEDDAAKYLDAIVAGLAQSECNTVERIAMWLAQIGHESGDFVYTEEIGQGAGKSYAPYCGRTWIQITWQSNYAKFGQWCADKGLIQDPNQFVNDYESLADLQWAGIGAAWYWITQRPINDLIDAGDQASFSTDVGSYSGAMDCVTAAINGGLTNIDDRRARYAHALAVGDDLLKLIPTATDNGGTVDVNDPNQLNRIEAKLDEVLAQLHGNWPQNGNDMQAAKDLDARKAAGDRLTLNDNIVWLRNHASTHKAPTP